MVAIWFVEIKYDMVAIWFVEILTVSEGSYLNAVPKKSYLKAQNCQIWQSGTEASVIRGNLGVKENF